MVSNRPLLREELFQVSIDKLNPEWTSSLMLGVLAQPPDKLHLPVSTGDKGINEESINTLFKVEHIS